MVSKAKKEKNLIGFIGQVRTELEIWQTSVAMEYTSTVAQRFVDDLETLLLNCDYYLDVYADLSEEGKPFDAEDLPF